MKTKEVAQKTTMSRKKTYGIVKRPKSFSFQVLQDQVE